MKFIKKNENEHIISKNKSMFGRKYLTELNVYFPYHYIFWSASHTLQKPQTKDSGSGSYFFFFSEKRKTTHFIFNHDLLSKKYPQKYK